jgi:hypothetical protein
VLYALAFFIVPRSAGRGCAEYLSPVIRSEWSSGGTRVSVKGNLAARTLAPFANDDTNVIRINISARHRAKKRKPGPDCRRGEMFVWEKSKSSNLQIIIFGRKNGAQFHDILIFRAWVLGREGKGLILFFWGGGPCANEVQGSF